MDMDEQSPLVGVHNCPNHYGVTKVAAEKLTRDWNGRSGESRTLSTVCVRPCSGIFGPNDNIITEPALRDGEIKIFIPDSVIDYVFVENVVYAHLLAEIALTKNPEQIGGEVFCISNNEPIMADDLYNSLQHFYEQKAGKQLKKTYLPRRLLTALAYMVEAFQALTHRRISGELSNLTPAMINLAQMSYAFSSAKAQRLLNYQPLYNVDEGMQRTVELSKHVTHHRNS